MLNAGGQRVAIGLHLTLTAPFKPLSAGYRAAARWRVPAARRRRCGWRMLRRLDATALDARDRAQFEAFVDGVRPRRRISSTGISMCICFRRCARPLLEAVERIAPQAWVRQCGSAPAAAPAADRPKGLLLDCAQPRIPRARRERSASPPIRPLPAPMTYAAERGFRRAVSRASSTGCRKAAWSCAIRACRCRAERLDPLTTLREREYAYFCGDAFPAQLLAGAWR